jgi:hypothetical protein
VAFAVPSIGDRLRARVAPPLAVGWTRRSLRSLSRPPLNASIVTRTSVRQLFLKTALPFRGVADQLASRVLGGFEVQERDGLNLGGGEYFMLKNGDTVVVLVSNDADHAEVFVPSHEEFRYYCYVWRGPEEILERMFAALPGADLAGKLAEDA